jgi:hypothetical protein
VYLQLSADTAESEIESFTKVILLNQVVTAGLFDPKTYTRFNPEFDAENRGSAAPITQADT